MALNWSFRARRSGHPLVPLVASVARDGLVGSGLHG